MSRQILMFLAVFALATPQLVMADDIDCGFYNEIEITDPVGDQTGGAPGDVDILSLQIRQVGDKVQFEWTTNGTSFDDSVDVDCIMTFDTDRDPTTGSSGAEMKIWVWPIIDHVYLSIFDENGGLVSDDPYSDVTFVDDGFTLTLASSHIPSDHFDIYFQASGGDPFGGDQGSTREIQLQPIQPPVRLVVEADTKVSSITPPLIYLPEKDVSVELRTYISKGSSSTLISSSEVEYLVGHPAPHAIPDPEEIISIDSNGNAHCHSEGYISVVALIPACGLTSTKVIVAAGDLYGNPEADNVLAVFPDHYAPKNNPFTFGDMISNYPNYIKTVNAEYDITSDLYTGFVPFDGDTQIFALLDIPDHCGGAGNPLETGPCCYMDCDIGTGEPDYITAAHEMGHNFHDAPGMAQLLFSSGNRFGDNFEFECVASLPVNYMFREIYLNGQQYGLGPGTHEWAFFSQFAEDDNFEILEDFEDFIDGGQTTGYFDMDGLYDKHEVIALLCSFFQAYLFEYDDYSSPHGHEFIRRFLNIWGDTEIPGFQEEKAETYFAASFCAAVGKDVRDKLRYWGFTIDDEFYDQIMPMIESRIELFSSRFEFGDLHKWAVVRP